ncbi:MAG: repeat-containing protein [Capsulimonas sp.]|jgi:tetratricopeptide (TPR) repeat protein|nr:repeat-containing protein [Capsulimonas sp.]
MNTTVFEDASAGESRRMQARARRLAKRAETLASEGRVDEAIACQAEVVNLQPENAVAMLKLGILFREARRIDAALTAFRKASFLNPNHRDSREALIDTLLETGRFPEVIAEAKVLLSMLPRSIFARDVLSIAYLQVGQIEKALHVTAEMVRLDPYSPSHHYKRALLFQQQGNVPGAVREFSRARDLAEENTDLYDEAEEALDALDEFQMRQILLLASEDWHFQHQLRTNADDAVAERGYALSDEGLTRIRHLTQEHFSEVPQGQADASNWGGARYYN